MKKIINILFLAGISLISLSSCEDFLEADNLSAVSADDQFSTPEDFETLVNQAYFTLREVYAEPAIFCTGTDLYAGIRAAGEVTFETYSLAADNQIVYDLFVNLFSVVNASNCVLYYADNIEDYEEKAARLEEAKFLRAYAYYMLIQQFGGVPIFDAYITTADTYYPRNTLEDCYTYVIDELTALASSTVLSDVDYTGRASVQAAKALLAKTYLAAGWDLETTLTDASTGAYTVDGTTYFDLAASTAAALADLNPLTQSFEDKWSPDNASNAEVLFAIQWDRATSLNSTDDGHSQQNNFGTYLGAVDLGLKFVASDLNPTSKTFHLFEKGDERYDATFMTQINNYDASTDTWTEAGYWSYYNGSADSSSLGLAFYFPAWYVTDTELDSYMAADPSIFVSTGKKNVSQIIRTSEPVRWISYNTDGTLDTDETDISYLEALTRVGTIPPIKKFDDPNTVVTALTGDGSYRDLVVLNVSEIYLVAAEAYLMAGNAASALTYLNAVRTRAGAATITDFASYQRYDPSAEAYVSADQDIDVILDERARELLGEYYRWMDLRRTKQLVKYNLNWNPSITDIAEMQGGDGAIKWLRPIPAAEIAINTGISESDQNPGYSGSTVEE